MIDERNFFYYDTKHYLSNLRKSSKEKNVYSVFIFYFVMILNLGFSRKKHVSEIKNILVSHKRKISTLESNGMIWTLKLQNV